MRPKPTKKTAVLIVASEAAPFAHVGGLGDIIQGLARGLLREDVEVAVIIPRYEFIEKSHLKLIAKNIPLDLGSSEEYINLYEGKFPQGGGRIFFIENKTYISTGPIYFSKTALAGSWGEIQRFIFFSKAVDEVLKHKLLPFEPDIVHLNDWHTGALANFIKARTKKTNTSLKTLFTIHNLENQGLAKTSALISWLTKETAIFPSAKSGKLNLISDGITSADFINTVSPSYAEEIKTAEYGAGLEKLLSARQNSLVGILNGIDYGIYNPETDTAIFQNFSANHPKNKTENKLRLQELLGLKRGIDYPLCGLVSRLTKQKGIDFILPNIEKLIKEHNAQFVFVGTGENQYEQALRELSIAFPENVYARLLFDKTLAHRVYAASDFFLMPSRFEPCGLGQMISMRYGSIPIVRKTGGLKDTVSNRVTGFVFEKASSEDFQKSILDALLMFKENPESMQKIQSACFLKDWSINTAARKYRLLYEGLL